MNNTLSFMFCTLFCLSNNYHPPQNYIIIKKKNYIWPQYFQSYHAITRFIANNFARIAPTLSGISFNSFSNISWPLRKCLIPPASCFMSKNKKMYAPAQCSVGCGFDSCQGLSFFSLSNACVMLISSLLTFHYQA